MREERDCGTFEFLWRRVYSGILYWRIYRLLRPSEPYYTPGAIRELERRIDTNSKVFEWGSGQSGIWFAERVREYVGVEHSRAWYEEMTAWLRARRLEGNAKIVFCPPRDMERRTVQETDRDHPRMPSPQSIGSDFKEYVEAIDGFPDNYFDCIAIDGRERVRCALHAVRRLKDDGCIVLDDSHRPRYSEIFRMLEDWRAKRHDFGLLQTTIFTRDD